MASKAVQEKDIDSPTKHIAVIRIRGRVGLRKAVVDTLRFLRLHRKNHLVIIDDRPSYRGMLQTTKDYITWGDIEAEVIEKILQKRGYLTGNTRLTDALIKKYTNYETIADYAKAIANFDAELSDFEKLKPVFRLHPPKGGFKGKIKRPVKDHGELGNRGLAIKDLIDVML